jgi:glycosyltransferase 2 family protein
VEIRRILRYLVAACGVALFGHLIYRVGFANVLNSIQQIGWGLAAIVAVGGCIFMARSVAWRLTLGQEYRRIPLWTLLRTYIAAESMGVLFFGGPAVADATRVFMLGPTVPTVRVIASVTLDRGLYLVGSAIFLTAAIFLLPFALHRGAEIPTYAYAIGILYSLIMASVWIAMRRRVGLITGLFSLLMKVRPLRRWIERRRAAGVQVEDAMFQFLNTDRPGFWTASALNLAAHALAAFEVFLVLWFLGSSRSPLIALCIEGMTKLANISGTVIPGNVGAYEAGNMVILKLLGYQVAIGLVLALSRDLRRIFWVAVGLFLFFLSGFHRLPEPRALQEGPKIS